jgi:hypothetical protein
MGSRGAMSWGWGLGGCFHGDVAKLLGGMAAPAHLVVVVIVCRVLWVVFSGGTDFSVMAIVQIRKPLTKKS